MNSHNKRSSVQWGGVFVMGLWLVAVSAWGGVITPLYVGNTSPVLDQNGEPMVGAWNMDPALCSRVEVRIASDGVVRPPSTNGTAHPFNPLLSPEGVGYIGLNAYSPGIFAMVFTNRPAAGTMIFVRVFNAPTAAEATFYSDSVIAEVPLTGSSLPVTLFAAQPLDEGDIDFDGLNNSWERALGIDDRLTPDYDGDGMSDLHEWMAGTGASDTNSLFAIRAIGRDNSMTRRAIGDDLPVLVQFQSVPGKSYQLECVPLLTGEQECLLLGDVVTAEEGETELEMLVDLPADTPFCTLRIRLVTD